VTDGSGRDFVASTDTPSLTASESSESITLVQADGGPTIDLFDAEWILKAAFDRLGFDLMIEGHDGEQILIRDYFAQAEPADLKIGAEGTLKGHVVERLAGPAPMRWSTF
jgi:hypothetical protein